MRKAIGEKEYKYAFENENIEKMAAYLTQDAVGLIHELLIQKQIGTLRGIKEGLQIVIDSQQQEIKLWKERYSELMTQYTCVLQGELGRGGDDLNNDPVYEKFRLWRDAP